MMRWKQHLVIFVVCVFAVCDARNVIRNFPLLQFREIADVKLIYKHENVNVRNYELQPVLDLLMDEIIKTSFENNEFVPERETLIKELKELNYTYGNFIKSPPHQTANIRQKRSWDAFGNALKWAGGVMNSEDRYELRRYLQQIHDNQTKINQKMDSIMTQLNLPSELKAEKSDEKLIELRKDLKRFKESLLMQEFKERFALFSIKINAIIGSYVNGRLDSELIDESIVQALEASLNQTTNGQYQFACKTALECIRNSESKFTTSNGKIRMSLKIPVIANKIFKLYEVASVPAAYFDHVIIYKPQHKYYSYDHDNDELIAFNTDYRRSCFASESSTLFCTTEDIISSVNIHDCVLTAIRDKIIDTEICADEMELHQLDDFAVIKFDKRRFWIHSELPNAVHVSCSQGNEDVKNVIGNLIVDLSFECRGMINNLKLVTYALNEDQHFATFNANISKESFRDVINTMAPTSTLSSDLIYDIDTMKITGLKEKVFIGEESVQAKNQWQENEIKVLHAEHNKFIIIALVLAVGALLFIVFRRHKSILILTSRKESDEEPPQYSDEKDESDTSLNINRKSNYKS